MTIKVFNPDILELHYISNLLEAKPVNKDIYHCSIYLVCKYNLENIIISKLENKNDHLNNDYDDVLRCIKDLFDINPSFEEFIEYLKGWGKEKAPFTNIMKVTSPVIINVLRNTEYTLLENEPDAGEKEQFFIHCYGLNDIQIELIRFTYFITDFPYSIFENFYPKPKTVFKYIADATFIPYPEVVNNLNSDSKLLLSKIILFKNDYGGDNIPQLNNRIINFIEDTISFKDLMNSYSLIDNTVPYPLESFTVDNKHTNIIKLMLSSEKTFQILFYGEPGTGKTEYAKSIASELGKRPRFILYGNSRMDIGENRLWALQVTLNTLTDNDLLIIDEADYLLNTEVFNDAYKIDKGKLNTFFDSIDRSIIWITNNISSIHRSLRRRFAYSIRFEPFSIQQREIIWKITSKKYSLTLTDENISSLSRSYNVNAAGIVHASNIAALLSEKTGDNATSMLKEILGSHNELIHGYKKNIDEVNEPDEYDVKYLNTDIPVERIIKACSCLKAQSNRKEVRHGLCVIFYGLPGTGKSETAKYIARQIDSKIIRKRYSDLVTKYVGETEEKIAAAFNDAEEQNDILFIDEADAFFTERTDEKMSWEISRTNEFLSQIDSYKGILICCTNLIDLLDSAVYRRFAFKVNFLPVKKDKRMDLYNHFFGNYGRLTREQCECINSLNTMTPGDLQAVAASFMYEDNVTQELVIDSLKKECGFRIKKETVKIGF